MTIDPVARIQAALAQRSAAGLTVWWITEAGTPFSRACATEAQKADTVAALQRQGRVILSADGKAGLRARYVELIGYDPFADDASATEAEVAGILAEYHAEVQSSRIRAALATLGFQPASYGAPGRTFVRKGLRGESTLIAASDAFDMWTIEMKPYARSDEGARHIGQSLNDALAADARTPW